MGLLLINGYAGRAQFSFSSEDSLQISSGKKNATYLGGYGDVSFNRNSNLKTSTINLNRAVLFVGHRFNDRISFFSELELEDAKIAGGDPGGEFALEQCYIRFVMNRNLYLTAGLFTPRIGIINENHLPGNYHGVGRPYVERYVIPATWRELGIGLYGKLNAVPFNYSLAVCNGLNSASFEHGTGIRDGRFEGKDATANNLAVTASVQYSIAGIKLQASGYAGGSVGLSPKIADTLKLKSGIFGTPVVIGELNAQYENNGFSIKALGSIVSIPDAFDINRAYGNNTPVMEYGAYAEVAYNFLQSCHKAKSQQCWLFVRYEKLDLNSSIPSNGIMDETLKQDQLLVGLSYFPINNVVVKADLNLMRTGKYNQSVLVNPQPDLDYKQHNTFINVGLGYSF